MELKLIASNKASISVSDEVFSKEFNEPLVHQVVTAYLAADRAGTHAQKNRAAVRGGGAKPWRQKGTGRARAGTIRSPLWRKGGVTFAAQTQSYAQKINRKMYRNALRSIFSELIRQDRLVVIEAFEPSSHRTKDLLNKLEQLGLSSVLIIIEAIGRNLALSARNLPEVDVRNVADVDPVSLVRSEKVLITVATLKRFEELLG